MEQTLQDGKLYRHLNSLIVAHLRDNNLNQASTSVNIFIYCLVSQKMSDCVRKYVINPILDVLVPEESRIWKIQSIVCLVAGKCGKRKNNKKMLIWTFVILIGLLD